MLVSSDLAQITNNITPNGVNSTSTDPPCRHLLLGISKSSSFSEHSRRLLFSALLHSTRQPSAFSTSQPPGNSSTADLLALPLGFFTADPPVHPLSSTAVRPSLSSGAPPVAVSSPSPATPSHRSARAHPVSQRRLASSPVWICAALLHHPLSRSDRPLHNNFGTPSRPSSSTLLLSPRAVIQPPKASSLLTSSSQGIPSSLQQLLHQQQIGQHFLL